MMRRPVKLSRPCSQRVLLSSRPSPSRSRNVCVWQAITVRSRVTASAASAENQARSSSRSLMRVRPGPAGSKTAPRWAPVFPKKAARGAESGPRPGG